MTTPATTARDPKAFLSYSHSSPEHVERVVRLAEDLHSQHVQLVFDQWDLREGQDLHSFMEQAVNDPDVTHVLVLCDPLYAEKADGRRGGVGSETLIISPGVYGSVEQRRVIPIIMARDESDQIRVPTYLNGRTYIDLSSEERASTGYEQLLRALFSRPIRTRPPLGPLPAFLDENYVALETSGASRIAGAAIKAHRLDAAGRLADYLDRLTAVIAAEELTITSPSEEELLAKVRTSIERFLPYRDEFIGLCKDIARYAGDRPELYDRLHEFFENIVSIRLRHQQLIFRAEAETENLAFIGWELMLLASATMLRQNQFNGLSRLLRPLYVRTRYDDAGVLQSIDVLEPGFVQLSRHDERQQQRWSEPVAQMLRDRQLEDLPFEAVMEADLLLWYRTVTDKEVEGVWTPRTLVYAESLSRLPLFARARAGTQFARLAPALGVQDRGEFVQRFREIPEERTFSIGRVVSGRSGYARLLDIHKDE